MHTPQLGEHLQTPTDLASAVKQENNSQSGSKISGGRVAESTKVSAETIRSGGEVNALFPRDVSGFLARVAVRG